MSNLIIEEKTGLSAFAELRSDWQNLFARTPAPPFLSWEWMSAWQKFLGAGISPRFITAYEGKKLTGLLALGDEEIRLAGIGIRRTSLLGSRYSGADYLGVLTLPEHEIRVINAICEYLKSKAATDFFEFDDLALDGQTLSSMECHFINESQFKLQRLPRFTCPQIELETSWDEMLRRSRRGKNYQRRLRQISARSGFDFRVVKNSSEIENAYDRFVKLHSARWHNSGGSEAIGHEALIAFHREAVIKMAHAGWVEFHEVWGEGECRATIYGFATGDNFYYFNAGYDPEWASMSVGLVALGLSIQNSMKRGLKKYDFLRGNESYKLDWATTGRETVSLQIANERWAPRMALLLKSGKEDIKSLAQTILSRKALENFQQNFRALKRQILL